MLYLQSISYTQQSRHIDKQAFVVLENYHIVLFSQMSHTKYNYYRESDAAFYHPL